MNKISQSEADFLSSDFNFDDMLQLYYDTDNITGGNLHIILADGNIEDSDIYFCYCEALQLNDLLGVVLCHHIKQLSMEQRETEYTNKWQKLFLFWD